MGLLSMRAPIHSNDGVVKFCKQVCNVCCKNVEYFL
uniref:Uncharacterized protein n=1 Tax=Parascaris equorum TaxID=6256 RepID=A0A914S424_PAREQ